MHIKVCYKCNVKLPIENFEVVSPNEKNKLLNPSYRNKCKKCRGIENKERIQKDPNFYKKQYAAMTEEQRCAYIRKKSNQNMNRPNIKEERRIYNRSDVGIYNRYKNDCNRRSRAKRGITMELNFEQFSKLINSECFYCGTINCRGVDRMDSSKSYTTENSSPCCSDCNRAKNDKSIEDFKKHIIKMYNKLVKP